jgi:hypothetical protein
MTNVTASDADPVPVDSLRSRGYHITLEDGRDSFFALSIEDPDSEDAWLISDTVHSLEAMR